MAGGLGLRKLLVVGQVALAVVLLIGAGLFVRTLGNLRAKGPGFETTNLVSFRLDPGRNGYTRQSRARRMRDVLAALRARPEVQSARHLHRGAAPGRELERARHHRVGGPGGDRRAPST